MRFRCVFVTDKRQVDIPDGWTIHHTCSVTAPRGKPQFQILLVQSGKPKQLGFSHKQ